MHPDDLAAVTAFARTGNLHDHLPAILRWRASRAIRLPALESLIGDPRAATEHGQGAVGGRAERIRVLRSAVRAALRRDRAGPLEG